MFQEFGITLDPEEVFKRFKGVKLYEIIDIVSLEHGVTPTEKQKLNTFTVQKSLGCLIQNWEPSQGLERSLASDHCANVRGI